MLNILEVVLIHPVLTPTFQANVIIWVQKQVIYTLKSLNFV